MCRSRRMRALGIEPVLAIGCRIAEMTSVHGVGASGVGRGGDGVQVHVVLELPGGFARTVEVGQLHCVSNQMEPRFT